MTWTTIIGEFNEGKEKLQRLERHVDNEFDKVKEELWCL